MGLIPFSDRRFKFTSNFMPEVTLLEFESLDLSFKLESLKFVLFVLK